MCLLDIKLVASTIPVEHFHDVVAALLEYQVFAGDAQLLFNGTDNHIGICYLRSQQYQRVIVTGDRGKQVCIGRFDAAAESPPEVDFPGSADAKVVLRVIEIGTAGGVCIALAE